MDVYYHPAYLKASALIEEGEVCVFRYDGPEGRVVHPLIKRPVPSHLTRERLYDAATPYGYGGPLVLEAKGSRHELIQAAHQAFLAWCHQQHIVSVFVRFHPLLQNAADFGDLYHAQLSRHTVATHLVGADVVASEFGKSARKNFRRAVESGVTWRLTEGPGRLDAFVDVYRDTMDRAGARDFYYFPPAYFELLSEMGSQLVTLEICDGDQIMAAGLYLLGDRFAHAHLSGTYRQFLPKSPAVVLKAVMAEYCAGRGLEWIHYGGGVTAAEDDPLFLFKKQFTRQGLFPFYLGRLIVDEAAYEALTQAHGGHRSDFFPAYRG